VTTPSLPTHTPSLDTAPLRAAFQAKLEALKDAAKSWGVQPEHAEGVFISTMIGTQEGFAELAVGLVDGLQLVLDEARRLAQMELERQRTALKETQIALNTAKFAASQMELEKERVTTKLIAQVVPDMIKATKTALVIREQRFNRNIEWSRAMGTGTFMLGLVLFGYVWGTWSDWGLSRRIESVGAAVQHCRDTSKWEDDKGQRLCELRFFVGD
jgi:hypothetical protein